MARHLATLLLAALAACGSPNGHDDAARDAAATPLADADTGPDAAPAPSSDVGSGSADGGPGSPDAGRGTIDAGPASTPPECVADADCGDDRGCLDGRCFDACLFDFFCVDEGTCHEGVCVECVSDSDCGGTSTCEAHACVREPLDPADVVIGAMYHQWWVHGRWESGRGNYRYEPSLGHYDNRDPDVVRRHHDWAERAGINTWVLDSWITDRDWWWMEPNTTAVMDEADRRGMRYFFLVDGWFEFTGRDDGFDAAAIAAQVVRRLGPWMARDSYVEVDGKPVVFFWAAWGKPCSLFERIRAGIEGAIGPIYMTGNNGDTSCWDRVMMYNPYSDREATHDGQIERQRRLWRGMEEDRHPWAPTTMPGYDDTRVRSGNPPIALDPEFFRRSLRTALEYDQRATPWLFVCSWSEWHEGSQIEPSSDFEEPEIFLDVMREELTRAGWL